MIGRPRSFDWDEARRLRTLGWTYARIGTHLGVTGHSVNMACDDAARERHHLRLHERAYWRTGSCVDCGAPVSRYRPGSRCLACNAREKTTTVRDDSLLCSRCRLWLPDSHFPNHKRNPARRDRHAYCRACQTATKREYRERHKGACETCGTPVDTDGRRDKHKPLECKPCSVRRIHAERRRAREGTAP